MKNLPVVKIALGALLFGLLPATLPAHADGISISVPGLSINIGSRDDRGYYWDGYDWRSPYWWQHRNDYYGHRNDRGYYWDGGHWRDRGWWDNHRHDGPRPPERFHGGPGPDHGGPDRGHGGGHDNGNHGGGDRGPGGGHDNGNHGGGNGGGHGGGNGGGGEHRPPQGGPGGGDHH